MQPTEDLARPLVVCDSVATERATPHKRPTPIGDSERSTCEQTRQVQKRKHASCTNTDVSEALTSSQFGGDDAESAGTRSRSNWKPLERCLAAAEAGFAPIE